MNEFYRSKQIPGVLGSKQARRCVENSTGYTKEWTPPHRPELLKVVQGASRVFDVSQASIVQPSRGTRNRARMVVIYLSHCIWKYPARELAGYFGVGISGITQISSQLKKAVMRDQALSDSVGAVKEMVMGA